MTGRNPLQEGFDAFGQGKASTENPYYLSDQIAASQWHAGWLDAQQDWESQKAEKVALSNSERTDG